MNSLIRQSDKGILCVRIVFGILLIVHGFQVFKTDEMNEYGPWLAGMGVPFPLASAYAGKVCELIGGLCLITGLFVRPGCVLVMGTFLFIIIVMGEGKIFTDAQHPFMFFLFALLFFFTGDGGYSVRRFFR